jgi:hypothetical protein
VSDVDALLGMFSTQLHELLAVEALWAHGSLAMGDFQPGRSDLDMVALVPTDLTADQRVAVQALHEELSRQVPLGSKLHCCYLGRDRSDDFEAKHPTWTQGVLDDKPLTPVSRRELLSGGRVYEGPAPFEVLRPVTNEELSNFIRTDLRDFWYPATTKRRLWLRTIWVDLGPITVARATVTLRNGQLITKAEALSVLTDMGAAPALVDDIRRRRYGEPTPAGPLWRNRRGELARRFVRASIDQMRLRPR